MSQTSIDRTILVNTLLPKSWKCPHCGKRQTFIPSDEEILIRYGKLIRHCETCGYLHSWELKLTDEFKKAVADMVMGWAERKEE